MQKIVGDLERAERSWWRPCVPSSAACDDSLVLCTPISVFTQPQLFEKTATSLPELTRVSWVSGQMRAIVSWPSIRYLVAVMALVMADCAGATVPASRPGTMCKEGALSIMGRNSSKCNSRIAALHDEMSAADTLERPARASPLFDSFNFGYLVLVVPTASALIDTARGSYLWLSICLHLPHGSQDGVGS